MVSRSIIGRFLILAVLLVSLGVIAQAAIIISKGSAKTVAKGGPAPASTLAALAVTPAQAATSAVAPAQAATSAVAPTPAAPVLVPATTEPVAGNQAADAAPVRVVYPGPLAASTMPPAKITDAAPSSPLADPAPVRAGAPAAAVAATPQPAPVAAVAPAKPSPVVVASADADLQPAAADPATPTGHGINLNSASVAALDNVGGGHIGQSIVKHRPYSSVEDLVKKRVVRRSVYEQIKNQLAAE